MAHRKYDREKVLNDLFEFMGVGGSVEAFCKQDGTPAASKVRAWLVSEDGMREKYAHARECRADTYFDEVLSIADDKTLSPDDRRIAIDARKWASSRLHPKYSDKVKHVGGDKDDAPIKIIDYSRMSDAELSRIAKSSEG
jgi:hypothetical protein